MRIARFTYKGAYHHVMSRGLNEKNIFLNDYDREYFISLLSEKSRTCCIDIFAFILMPNHYHIVLRNSSGKMSDMMRALNGGYGRNFRTKHGGKGYLFQDRYRSTLVQNKQYLFRVIRYTLVNVVPAGIVQNPFDYKWSSINCYFRSTDTFINRSLVEEMFANRKEFYKTMIERTDLEIKERKGVFGYYFGEDSFEEEIRGKIERRVNKRGSDHPHMRKGKEAEFLQRSNIKNAFMKFYGISDLDELLHDGTYEGKRRIDVLIKLLRDKGGLNYKQISKELGLKYASISKRYLRAGVRPIPTQLRNL